MLSENATLSPIITVRLADAVLVPVIVPLTINLARFFRSGLQCAYSNQGLKVFFCVLHRQKYMNTTLILKYFQIHLVYG